MELQTNSSQNAEQQTTLYRRICKSETVNRSW